MDVNGEVKFFENSKKKKNDGDVGYGGCKPKIKGIDKCK